MCWSARSAGDPQVAQRGWVSVHAAPAAFGTRTPAAFGTRTASRVRCTHRQPRSVHAPPAAFPENFHPAGHSLSCPASFHRRLPHWYRADAAYFLTWRLAGSLPASAIADRITSSGRKFVKADRLLDAATGPRWLTEAPIAESVVAILLRGELDGDYEFGAWVLMPNHIHVVLRPAGELGKTMAMLKARTARQANRYLGKEGQPFWSRDYFDHWIRNRLEEERIRRYIEQNPVKAGLCMTPEQWPWSSAASERGSRRVYSFVTEERALLGTRLAPRNAAAAARTH